jgi:hypothetical protein
MVPIVLFLIHLNLLPPGLVCIVLSFKGGPAPDECPACGYDTRATSIRCPECGSALPRTAPTSRDTRDRRVLRLLGLVFLGVPVLCDAAIIALFFWFSVTRP